MTLPSNEHPEYFTHYLSIVDEDLMSVFEKQLIDYPKFILEIPKEKELYRYAHGKWTIKEVVGHSTDTERVIFYRAFCIARGEQTGLPPFDEDAYVLATDFNSRDMNDLIDEFVTVRKNTIALYKRLGQSDLKRMGTASGKSVSSRALFYFIAGHLQHHISMINERYL